MPWSSLYVWSLLSRSSVCVCVSVCLSICEKPTSISSAAALSAISLLSFCERVTTAFTFCNGWKKTKTKLKFNSFFSSVVSYPSHLATFRVLFSTQPRNPSFFFFHSSLQRSRQLMWISHNTTTPPCVLSVDPQLSSLDNLCLQNGVRQNLGKKLELWLNLFLTHIQNELQKQTFYWKCP